MTTRPRRPGWLPITPISSEIDPAFDQAHFRCKRCEAVGAPVTGVGPPKAITREAADHVLAHHGTDVSAVEWARAVLPEVTN